MEPWGCHVLGMAHWALPEGVVGIALCPYLWGLPKACAGDEGGKDTCIFHFFGSSRAQMICHLPDRVGSFEHQQLFPDVPPQGHGRCQENPASAVHLPPETH